jgi:hypothetical protein
MYDNCPNAAPKNIAATVATLLANLGLLPLASEESAPMPVIVSVITVVVRSGIASFRTAAFRRCKREKHDIPRHVRSEDAPERQKTDGVHQAGDLRHSEQSVRYNFFSGWTARHKQLADRVHCDCSLPALPLKTVVPFHDRP